MEYVSTPVLMPRSRAYMSSHIAFSCFMSFVYYQVAIGYQQLGDPLIQDIPIGEVQDSGLLFMWVINAKYKFAVAMMAEWGYK